MDATCIAADWSPVVQALIGLAAGAITLVSTFALKCLREWLMESRIARTLRAARNGVAMAMDEAEKQEFDASLRTVEEFVIERGVAYMHGGRTGKAVEKLGYSEDRLKEMARSQLSLLRRAPISAPSPT